MKKFLPMSISNRYLSIKLSNWIFTTKYEKIDNVCEVVVMLGIQIWLHMCNEVKPFISFLRRTDYIKAALMIVHFVIPLQPVGSSLNPLSTETSATFISSSRSDRRVAPGDHISRNLYCNLSISPGG